MGFDNEAHYFFSTDLQRLEKKSVFFETFESQSPMGKVALCPNLNV